MTPTANVGGRRMSCERVDEVPLAVMISALRDLISHMAV